MSQFSLPVALLDFLPVAATVLALALLAAGVSRRHRALGPAAWAAVALAALGGACKATWKLLIALGGDPIPALEQILFPALVPALIIAAYSLRRATQAWRARIPAAQAKAHWNRLVAWIALPLGGAFACSLALPASRLAFFWLLGWATIGSAALCWNAIAACRAGGLGAVTVGAFAWNFVAALAMGGLARLPAGEASAWIQETVNLSGQLALAFGAWRLQRRMQQDLAP